MQNLLEQLKEFKIQEEQKVQNDKEIVKDVSYYGKIKIREEQQEILQDLYLVEKEIDGSVKLELHTQNAKIAEIGQGGLIVMDKEFSSGINPIKLLYQLQRIAPVSLERLEKIKQRKELNKQSSKKDEKIEEKEQENEEEKMQQDGKLQASTNYIAEIDLSKKITETKTFADLVPEVKEKQIQKVKVKRLDATRFEFYGEGKNNEYIPLETLKQVEGTNPTKEINEVNQDGSKVEKNQVYSMFRITNGTNEQAGNEGFSVDLEETTAIPKIAYYRRARGFDESLDDATQYTSIPVNLKNTNQKRTELEVREFAEKKRNSEIRDNVEKANDILEDEEKASLHDIDDNPYNDNIQDIDEYKNEEIRKAAKRCKVSEEAFIKEMEAVKSKNDTFRKQIEKAEDSFNEQVIGGRQI